MFLVSLLDFYIRSVGNRQTPKKILFLQCTLGPLTRGSRHFWCKCSLSPIILSWVEASQMNPSSSYLAAGPIATWN